MTITHKLINKKNPKSVLYGSIIEASYGPNWSTFDFQIEGSAGGNGFYKKDWEVEEILTLPENLYAIVQFEDEDYGTIRTFWRTLPDEWTETDTDYYSDEDLLDRVRAYAKDRKFRVLYYGVPAEPAKVAAEEPVEEMGT
jgi:hypothetical protein